MDLFALMIGFGLSGMFFRHMLSHSMTIVVAILCGLLFDLGVLRPLISLLFRAAAPPSEGLEGVVSQTATAETAFDRSGNGLIKFILDGQTVQLLGRMDHEELQRGVHICKGDSVVILEVDATKNICRVSRDLAE